MKTSTEGVEMDADITVVFAFTCGRVTVKQELTLDMDDFLKNPDEMGDTIRSYWFASREAAAETHKEQGSAT